MILFVFFVEIIFKPPKLQSRSTFEMHSFCYNTANLHVKRRTLLAVTTCQHSDLTKRFLKYSHFPENVDLIIGDDGSTDDTLMIAADKGIKVIKNPQRSHKGLISVMNSVYHYFLNSTYDYLVLVSNDIILPQRSLEEIIAALTLFPTIEWLGAMSNEGGLGSAAHNAYGGQFIKNFYDLPSEYAVNQIAYEQADLLENYLSHYYIHKDTAILRMPPPVRLLDGRLALAFLMAFPRSIANYQDKFGNLWPANLLNLHAEATLRDKGVRAWVATRAYVWHQKGSTVPDSMGWARDNLTAACS